MKVISLVVVAHDIRSCYNIGSLFRTADGLGVEHLFLTSHSPYPKSSGDKRPPHESSKVSAKISKSALGAEETMPWSYRKDVGRLLGDLKKNGFKIAALEQTQQSVPLNSFHASGRLALVIGNEVSGLPLPVLEACDDKIEIEMVGRKESLNVTVAAAIAIYQLKNKT